MVATSHLGLLDFKFKLIELNQILNPAVVLVTFQGSPATCADGH